MKNNIEYYQHFVNSHLHPKFKMLRVKYGWEGEGKFWALNNIIANSDECTLDISRKFLVADILELFGMTQKEFLDFVNYLAYECELINLSDEKITTEITTEILTVTMSKRMKNRKSYEERKEKSNSTSENEFSSTENQIQTSENIQRKGKESKGNEIKGKEKDSPLFQKIISFFKSYTKFSDPHDSQIIPILDLLKNTPENLTENDLISCTEKEFAKLDKNKAVNIIYLVNDIQSSITKKHEEVLANLKKIDLKEANLLRNEQKTLENNGKRYNSNELLLQLTEFFNKNQSLFSYSEKSKFVHFCNEKDISGLESLIKPKMEEVSFV